MSFTTKNNNDNNNNNMNNNNYKYTLMMPLDKKRHNDASASRLRISLYATTKMLVQLMEPLRTAGRNVLRKAFSDKYLLATNMTIALTLCTLADIIEQHIEHYMANSSSSSSGGSGSVLDDTTPTTNNKWDFKRTRNMGLSGCLVEFICHYWYQFLDRRMPENTINVVFKKIALDQLICAPIYITAFFVMLGILEDESASQIWKEVKTKAVRVYIAEWLVWPPAQFVNFYWLPPKYRVAYDSLISLGYDIYTSRVAHYDDVDESSLLMNKIQRSLFSAQDT